MVVVFLLVLIVVLAVLAAVHWYVWRRLVRDVTTRGSVPRRLGTVAVVVLPLLSFAALASSRAGAPFALQQVVAWPGFLWLALLLYVTLALLVGEAVRPLLLRWLGRRAQAAAPAEAPAPVPVPVPDIAPAAPEAPAEAASESAPETPAEVSRRLFVSRVVGGAAAAAAVGTVGYGTYGVLRGPRVKRVTVPLAKIPRAVHGYRIAVVSDIHLGPILGRAHTQRIVDTINSTQPDLIAVVGDLVDGTVENLGSAAEPLARLRARHGSFFVTGNHEYFSGADAWVDHVRELGLRPLRNERVEVAAGFDLAGVDDVAGESEGQGPDFGRALGDRDRARAAVLLAHQPIVVHDAVRHGVDLQLSGHTHGGQLWPGNYLAELANPTVAGLERYGDTQLYVSRGAGAWGPPVRVGAPSDITIVELASKQA
ncbi:putative MPP superfamily phosphohydrolase [Streptomyces sp. PvR006]|uniref:metallophosphoesterase n=1 Tax=unclassified Streptomyces TaxID=2593676 RepID=UPI001AE1ECE3|nr:metallophosphoesterase [Streptomyces sp. PvR006]MBP2584242.1 putative MPP superfamily phosphohydrolase [Streptomyces sp. PvR006]